MQSMKGLQGSLQGFSSSSFQSLSLLFLFIIFWVRILETEGQWEPSWRGLEIRSEERCPTTLLAEAEDEGEWRGEGRE